MPTNITDLLNTLLYLLIGGVVSPVVLHFLKRNKLNTDDAERIKDISVNLAASLGKRIDELTARLTVVEAEKESLRLAYENVLKELTERRYVEAQLKAEMKLMKEENQRLQNQMSNVKICQYPNLTCPFAPRADAAAPASAAQ